MIVVSNTEGARHAIEAMRHGAYHYISKDFDPKSIRTLFANAAERQDLSADVTRLKEEVAEQNDREFVVGPSRSTRSVVELVQKVARSRHLPSSARAARERVARAADPSRVWPADGTVRGREPRGHSQGTCRERALRPREGAFTGAIRQQLGKFELAAGGTLFLDEIGDLNTSCRRSCARVQEERSNASAARIRSRPISGSSPRPTSTSKRPSRTAASVRTSTTAST